MRSGCAPAIALSLFGALAGSARAVDQVTLVHSPFHGLGGEFRVTPFSGNSPGVTGKPADLSLDSMETFCMQADEYIAPGNVFRFEINTGVTSASGFDPVDPRTAYLYTYFRNGVLPGYDYGAGRAASAADLQNAIWFIEQENFGVSNGFVALANAAVASGGVWEGKGIGDVRVLNLFDQERNPVQDQLTLLPGPGPITLVVAAGALLARRRSRA